MIDEVLFRCYLPLKNEYNEKLTLLVVLTGELLGEGVPGDVRPLMVVLLGGVDSAILLSPIVSDGVRMVRYLSVVLILIIDIARRLSLSFSFY